MLFISSIILNLLASLPIPSPDCRASVTRAYHDLAVATAPQQHRILHLRFATETTFRVPSQNRVDRASSTGNLFIRGRQLCYQTPDVLVWQDGREVCTVLRRQQLVLLTRVPKPGEAGSLPPILMLRDSLIQKATVQLCRQEQVNGQTQQHVRLSLPTQLAQRLGLQTLDFYLTTTVVQLRRITAVYEPNHAARQVMLSFTQQEWLNAAPELTDNVRSQVFDNQGKMRVAYQGYRLIDQTGSAQKR